MMVDLTVDSPLPRSDHLSIALEGGSLCALFTSCGSVEWVDFLQAATAVSFTLAVIWSYPEYTIP